MHLFSFLTGKGAERAPTSRFLFAVGVMEQSARSQAAREGEAGSVGRCGTGSPQAKQEAQVQ